MDFSSIFGTLRPSMSASIQFLFGQFVPNCRHRIDKYFDDYYVLQYMDGGRVALDIDAAHYRLEGRYFWSSYPGKRIRFRPADGGGSWVHRYLAFRGPGVRRWIKAGLFPIAPQQPPPKAEYGEKFDEILEFSRRNDRWGLARAALLMETILTELAEARSHPDAMPAWLESALARITSPGEPVDHEKLANEAGMSPRSFRRRFAEAMGTSPRSYAIACRLGHAKQMLAGTELPIKTIARQLGYNDVFFFSRQFTGHTGISPAAYRRNRDA